MNTVVKEGVSINYDNVYEGYGKKFGWWNNFDNYERRTFALVKEFADPEGVFMDIGGHIGAVAMFAAKLYDRVYTFEPDPFAFKELNANLLANNFSNVFPINKAISDTDGETLFGGNGVAGNGESTLLVNYKEFMEGREYAYKTERVRDEKKYRNTSVWNVKTTTIKTIQKEFDLDNVRFIKIDIEGGEKIVIPSMKDFLQNNKGAILFLSLHGIFLTLDEVHNIIRIIFEIYPYVYNKHINQLTLEDALKIINGDLLCSHSKLK